MRNQPGLFFALGSEELTLSKQGRPVDDYGDDDNDYDDEAYDDTDFWLWWKQLKDVETFHNAMDYLQNSSKAIQRNFSVLLQGQLR